MAGSWPNAAMREKFISGITAAQTMGMPVDEEDRPTFYLADPRSYPVADSDGRVWDPRSAEEPTGPTPPDPVQVVCGKKVLEVGTDQTAAGDITPVAIRLTFLPAAWELVSEFIAVDIGGVRYYRGETRPPSALFDVPIVRVDVRVHDAAGITVVAP